MKDFDQERHDLIYILTNSLAALLNCLGVAGVEKNQLGGYERGRCLGNGRIQGIL